MVLRGDRQATRETDSASAVTAPAKTLNTRGFQAAAGKLRGLAVGRLSPPPADPMVRVGREPRQVISFRATIGRLRLADGENADYAHRGRLPWMEDPQAETGPVSVSPTLRRGLRAWLRALIADRWADQVVSPLTYRRKTDDRATSA